MSGKRPFWGRLVTYRYVSDTALRVAQIFLLLEAVVRGLNYLASPPGSSITLNQLELTAPLWVWGWLFITLGAIGLFGEALMSGTKAPLGQIYNPRAWPSFFAHSALMFTFITCSVATIVAVAQREPFYGFVGAYDLFAFAVGHWVFARRRKHVR